MTLRVGINGFGRIGRSVLRILSDRGNGVMVVAVNELFDTEQASYLLRYDTVMGPFEHDVRLEPEALVIDGERIVFTGQRDPAQIPWREMGVDYVIESSGVFRDRAALEKHLSWLNDRAMPRLTTAEVVAALAGAPERVSVTVPDPAVERMTKNYADARAEADARIRADERERCAKMVDLAGAIGPAHALILRNLAAAIRAMNEGGSK